MLVVFEIDDCRLTPGEAGMLAQRETLWVFCKTWKVMPDWMMKSEGDTMILIPPPESKKKPNKRATPRGINGSVSEG